MNTRDLRALPAHERLQADVCVIGSGPAGATVALELANTGLKTIVVESGGLERDRDIDRLNEIESIGRPRIMDQWLVRNRMLGGTSNTWAGRCAPFDEIDFEQRQWVPYSGWPFGLTEVTPYLGRSCAYLGLSSSEGHINERSFWKFAGQRKPAQRFDRGLLLEALWQFSSDNRKHRYINFAQRLVDSKAPNVEVLLNATVTHINTTPSGAAVESVEIGTTVGDSRKLWAPTVVLCAGGIENARLLLASRRVLSNGLGNEHDLVGRFLMDHLKGKVGGFDPAHAIALRDMFGHYSVKSSNGRHWFHLGARLSPAAQREHGLLNSALFLDEYDCIAADDPWIAARRMLRCEGSPINNALAVVSDARFVSYGLYEYLIQRNSLPRRLTEAVIRCIVEQRPDPESRVTLSDRIDRFGVPLSRINWKVSEQERKTTELTAKFFAAEVRRIGLAEFRIEDWIERGEEFPPHFQDIAHPTGTTRMSAHRNKGVVDPSCQVHGTSGLYIAGSSVFPTAGHANPTQMIVALAIRLADTLKQRLVTNAF
jgi:choline dehydrogenase-like flavoprotein